MKKNLLLAILFSCASFALLNAQDSVTIKQLGDIVLPDNTTPREFMLGSSLAVKASYTNPETATAVSVTLLSCTDWASDWFAVPLALDPSADGMIETTIAIPADFPLISDDGSKNNIQYVQVITTYPGGDQSNYELLKVIPFDDEKDSVRITMIGDITFPDTIKPREFQVGTSIPVQALYSNAEAATVVSVSLTSSTDWSTGWKSASVTIEPPYTGIINTNIDIPLDFPVGFYPDSGTNNVQYIQVQVTYPDGKVQPYELVTVTGGDTIIIPETIEDYLTSMAVTMNDDNDTLAYKHSGWTVIGDRMLGEVAHFQGTYEVEKNGHKATSINIAVSDFKADWSGLNWGVGTEVANEAMGNLNGVIDHYIRIPYFFPEEFLVTDDPAVSNQLLQIRVTYDYDAAVPIDGGIYSNYWTDIIAATETPSTCMEPAELMTSDITDSTVTLSWNMGNDAAWDIIVAEEGTIRNPESVEDFMTVYVLPYTMPKLKPGTAYEVHIRSVCDNDTTNRQQGAYAPAVLFTTTGEPIVGIEKLSTSSVDLYPNPTSGMMTISTELTGQVEVFDITGRVVITAIKTNPVMNLELSELPSGMYFLRLSDGLQSVTKKFMKE